MKAWIGGQWDATRFNLRGVNAAFKFIKAYSARILRQAIARRAIALIGNCVSGYSLGTAMTTASFYRPGCEIARGSMSVVLDVGDQKLGHSMAMKAMPRRNAACKKPACHRDTYHYISIALALRALALCGELQK